ncbi:MAG: hypothetical protein QXK47_04450 [Candidatus Bathyarchaeia archaeon]|nr:hypothetical protein [Candidatus Bathyarchaeota archaeon]
MPETKANTTTMKFVQIEVNLLIRATDHLIDAYKSLIDKNQQIKATVTILQKLKKRLSRASSRLKKQS